MENNVKKGSSISSFVNMAVYLVVFALVVFLGVRMCGNSSSSSAERSSEVATESHSVSAKHVEAKNALKRYLQKQMKDPASYQEIEYTVFWSNTLECYMVDLTFSGANSFGGKTRERWQGQVTFDDTMIHVDNVEQRE